jgi:hypothetical protein
LPFAATLFPVAQDKIIGKKVLKVRGAIPAGNYIRLPRTKLQSLGLAGRFLYIQVSAGLPS